MTHKPYNGYRNTYAVALAQKQTDGSIRRNLSLASIAAALLLFALTARSFATVKMAPYLQAVTTNSVYVLVECDTTANVTAEYGTTSAYGSTAVTESKLATTASPVTYVHRVKLTGLQPNTQYHYRVSQGGTVSMNRTFNTAVNPGTPFRFAFMADTRTQTTIHDRVTAKVKAANPRFSLYGGDLCADPTYTSYKSQFFTSAELSTIGYIPFFNTPGNHEDWAQNTKAFTQAPASASGTQDFYSFDYGDVHFVCMNNEISYAVGSAQYNFVRDDLAASKKPWKIVFFHQPAYCVGGHGENAAMKTVSANLFVPNKVDMTFAGHSHFYQHNLVSGIHHMVLGSAGAPLYDPGTASYTVKSAKAYEYGIIDVTPTTLKLSVFNDAGTLIETVNLTKTLAPTPTPVANVSLAKAKTNGSALAITSPLVVTLVPAETGVFYVQDASGTSGIRCETTGTKPALGATVTVTGTLATKPNGERALTNAVAASTTAATTKIRAVNNREIGGRGYVGSETVGLNNQGLLVKVWGRVTKSVTDATLGKVFFLDDGSKVDPLEADGTKGIKIIDSGLTPATGTFMVMTGVVGSEMRNGKMIRVIRFKQAL